MFIQSDGGPEQVVYDNTGVPYDDGIFTIDLTPPEVVEYVIVRRPPGTILTICEVEVYGGMYFLDLNNRDRIFIIRQPYC